MRRLPALIAALVVAVSVPAAPPTAKPSGVYLREIGDYRVRFDFRGDELQIVLSNANGKVTFETTTGLTKDGVLFGHVNSVDRQGIEHGDKGDLFSFQLKQEAGKITVSELRGSEGEEAKKIIEGVYKAQ